MSLNVEVLEQSFAKIRPYVDQLGASFYENLFAVYPEAKPLFAHTDMRQQEKRLADLLVMAIDNMHDPEELRKIFKRLGARHVRYGAMPKHYPIIGAALLKTMMSYIGESWTTEVKHAWIEAYGVITDIMLKGAAEEVLVETHAESRY